jgi:hypothetical protein
MKRSFAASLMALLLLAGWRGSAGAAPPSQLVQLEQLTAKIRHLTPLHRVKADFLPSGQFDSVVQTNTKRGESDADIELAQRESVLLGLLSSKDDYRKILFQNVTSQVMGLYDDTTRTLYVRTGSTNVLGIDRHYIAHEYTHALQDQHYHLLKLLPDESNVTYRNSDQIEARHALVEGDAVNTEILYISRSYSPAEIHALATEPQPKVQPLPAAVQREFDFPYTSGLQFVQDLYQTGGMKAVDGAYTRLPGSTYEIMHPAAYVNGWKPRTVTIHGVRGFSDWKQMDDDVNGAFGIELILWQHLDKSTAVKVTNAYRGDRYIFLENGAQDAMLLKSVWTTRTTALAAKTAWVQSLKGRFPGGKVTGSGATSTVEAATTSVYVHVSGAKLTVAYAPTLTMAQQLGTAQTD